MGSGNSAVYARMTRLATLLGAGPRKQETPLEFGVALADAAPEAGNSASRIAEEYARYRFGRQTETNDERLARWWRFVRNALILRIGRLRR